MKGLVFVAWMFSVIAALFWQPVITAITTIALATMLLCVAIVLVEIRDALWAQPAASKPTGGTVGMFASEGPKAADEGESEIRKMYYGSR